MNCRFSGSNCGPLRTNLRKRLMFGKYPEESGLTWYEYRFKSDERLRAPFSIAFAFVATHNHFVLDRGGKVFNRSAPIIKLPADATEDDHLALLGLLNSSTACFWMKQVTQIKTQTTGMDSQAWQLRREFDGTKLKALPIPESKPLSLSRRINGIARQTTASRQRIAYLAKAGPKAKTSRLSSRKWSGRLRTYVA